MKKVKKSFKKSKGFTLIEMLVVVLIIGILAGIALPQYQMAVTKAKVASILPIMRRWKDAMYEYKLQNDSYCPDDDCGGSGRPDGSVLGVNWPSDWKSSGDNTPCGDNIECENDYWYECMVNEDYSGEVCCTHIIDENNQFQISMYQFDDYEGIAGMITCQSEGTEGDKVCKGLGGKLLEEVSEHFGHNVYRLN